MTIQIGLGISKLIDSYQAGRIAALQARRTIQRDLPCLGILFSSVNFHPQQVLDGIHSALPDVKILGCSGAGIITSSGINKHAVALMLIASDKIQFVSDVIKEGGDNYYTVGHDFAHNLLKSFGQQQRDFFLFFVDGTHINVSELISGIHSLLGNSFPVLGGVSSDDLRFTKSFQYLNDKFYSDKCIGTLCKLGGNFSFASKHGWKPLGRPRLITKAKENLLIEIENRPAISIYEDYFGTEHIKDLKKGPNSLMALLYPLGIYKEGEKEYLLRNVFNVKDERILVCQGNINEGEEIRLMIGNKDSCLDASRIALTEAKNTLKTNKPKAAIIFDSVLRIKLLGRETHHETEIIKEVLGEETPFIGFYSYGEYTPLESLSYHGRASLHNGTFSVLLLGG